MNPCIYPKSFPRSLEIEVRANGVELDVLQTDAAYFVSLAYTESVRLEIRSLAMRSLGTVSVSPARLGFAAMVERDVAILEIGQPELLHIQLQGVSRPLFFYGNPPEEMYDGQATYSFKGGQIYEIGELELYDRESVYIESGAIVKGSIRANQASDIKIYGYGVLDGSYFKGRDGYRTILLYECSNVVIRDIIMIQPPCWMIMLAACDHVRVDRIKQIGEVMSSDGVDIVGSQDVLVENCIMRNNDDCVVVKGFDYVDDTGKRYRASRDVSNVAVRSCTLVNAHVGHAIEIGHELTIDSVKDVVFENIDIVSVHGHGAPFSIHVGDRATVEEIVFRNIRVEHYYDKLVDFRVMRSRYNVDEQRGRIRNVLLQDIRVTVSPFNPGYSVSIIGGYDAEHPVENVVFDNFYLGDAKITDGNQLDLYVKEAKGITFR